MDSQSETLRLDMPELTDEQEEILDDTLTGFLWTGGRVSLQQYHLMSQAVRKVLNRAAKRALKMKLRCVLSIIEEQLSEDETVPDTGNSSLDWARELMGEESSYQPDR